MKEQKWIITAVNNLTGEREAVSRPHSRWKTEELLTRARRDQRRHRKQACYSLYRMERFVEQEGKFPFAPLKSGCPECSDCKSVPGKPVLSRSGISDYLCNDGKKRNNAI